MKTIYVLLTFLIGSIVGFSQSPAISSYQYWVDHDFGNATSVSIAPQLDFHLQTDLDISGLEKGYHNFHIRFQDEQLKFSSVLTQLFYAKANTNHISAYEYWFDSDYGNKVLNTVSPSDQVQLLTSFDCSALSNGIHIIHLRFLDDGDKWSSVESQFFQKSANGSSAINQISAYRYWIDSAYSEINSVNLTSAQNPFHLIREIDLTKIPKGQHVFHIQFKDTTGNWSGILSDTIIKNALPIADFSFTSLANCDSTVVTLSNLSFDGDSYFWDFGNGTQSSDSIPPLTYFSPGSYQISLTVSDSNSGLDSTLTKEIIVMGSSSASSNLTACNQVVSPSGKYIWTQSGIYSDTIVNHFGCDSLLSIQVNINTLDAIASNTDNVLTAALAGASYQWIDCTAGNQVIAEATQQSFTPTHNGSYAVIVNDGICSDTSSCLLVDNLRVDELISSYGITVFPNPANDILHVFVSKAGTLTEIRIKDLTGRVLITKTAETSALSQFDIRSFSEGIYFVEFLLGKESCQLKFIKT